MHAKRLCINPETIRLVKAALYALKGRRARHGLPAPIKDFEIAHDGTVWFGKKIHVWITIADKKIGLRIAEHPSRPKRRVLRELMCQNSPPTLIVYATMALATVVHKLAQCIKTGLNRVRYGLIQCIKEKVQKGLVHRCDNGGFVGRIPNQFQLSAMRN